MRNIITMILVLCSLNGHTQNLIPNGDFEDRDTISTSYTWGENYGYYPKGWYDINLVGSPDYVVDDSIPTYTNPNTNNTLMVCGQGNWAKGVYLPDSITPTPYWASWGNSCHSSILNNLGTRLSHSGTAHIHMGYMGEMIGVKLLKPLKSGRSYAFEFWTVTVNHPYNIGSKYLGAAFTQQPIYQSILYDPQGNAYGLPIYDTIDAYQTYIRDTVNWIPVRDTIIAQGGELYMTFGELDSVLYNSLDTAGGYRQGIIMVDDFSLMCLDCPENAATIQAFNGNVQPGGLASNNLISEEPVFMDVFDICGRLLFSEEMKEHTYNYHIQTLPSGMYIRIVRSSSGQVIQKTIIVN